MNYTMMHGATNIDLYYHINLMEGILLFLKDLQTTPYVSFPNTTTYFYLNIAKCFGLQRLSSNHYYFFF
jgi:hypothetical protein